MAKRYYQNHNVHILYHKHTCSKVYLDVKQQATVSGWFWCRLGYCDVM